MRIRRVLHTLGIHHYYRWMWATAHYEAGPLLRWLSKTHPTEWTESVQVRRCRICGYQKIRRQV